MLLTHYAVEVATAEVDGLTSFFGVNNFYLYQLEGSQRFLFIPWDHDFNFTHADHHIYFGAERNRLVQGLLQDSQLGGDGSSPATQTFDQGIAQVQSVIAARAAAVDAQLTAERRRSVRH